MAPRASSPRVSLDSIVARPGVDLLVPDALAPAAGLARTTELGVGAHADDLEFAMLMPIGHCRHDPGRWFAGVTCTDGAGSARSGVFAAVRDAEMVTIRREEQRAAATIGAYGAMVQLGYPSASVRRRDEAVGLVTDLETILDAARPSTVYTHNLVDKHTTHAGVAVAVIDAIRGLPMAARPTRVLGVEGWRDLDWLADGEKVLLDTTGLDDLAAVLAACFPSQIVGGKRYDLAEAGRRRANATMGEPRAVDQMESASVAMDLTPLIRDDDLDPVAFVTAAIDRFRADVDTTLRARRR